MIVFQVNDTKLSKQQCWKLYGIDGLLVEEVGRVLHQLFQVVDTRKLNLTS